MRKARRRTPATPKDDPFSEKEVDHFRGSCLRCTEAMLDFADQRGSAAGPIRPIQGSTFAARPPVLVRAMRELADQIAGMGPTGFGSAALSMTAEPMQDALSLDNRNEMQEGRERREGTESARGEWSSSKLTTWRQEPVGSGRRENRSRPSVPL